jgi:glycosyltransferase
MKISIITISLNNASVIKETIDSVLAQNYDDLEYILIDGGSNDGSLEIIHSYIKKIDYFISERDTGIYNAINKGIGAATGDIVGLLHAGDVYSDFDVLANVNDAFVRHDTEIVYGHSLVFDKNRNRIVRKNISPVYKESLMKFGWFPSHQSTFFKSSVFSNYGSYNENYKISADYEFLLRLLHVNKIKPVMIDLFIVKFYLGGASSKNIFSVFKSNYECYRAWKKNKLRVPIYTIPLKILRKIMQLRINFFNK